MNYYEQIFNNLILDLNEQEALNEIVKIFLFRNTKFSMPEDLNKTDVFFQSSFIKLVQKSHLQNDDWQFALSQYFRFGKVDESLLQQFLNIDEESVIFSIRLSEIIKDLEHNSWTNIKTQQNNYPKLKSLIETIEHLHKIYNDMKSKFISIKQKWQWEYLDTIIFSSLYLYEVVLVQNPSDKISIPYQIDEETSINQESVFSALHFIITHSYKGKKLLTDTNLRPTLDNKLAPFIYGQKLTLLKIQEYEDFRQFVALKVELDLFDDFVFNSFSFDKSVNYIFKNENLTHITSSDDYDFFTEKFAILNWYWKWRGVQYIDENTLNKEKFDYWLKVNNPMHIMESLADTYSAQLLLKEIYGIEKIILNNNNEYDIFNTLFAIHMQKKYYQDSFINPFLQAYQLTPMHPFKILGMLTLGNVLTGENFYPVITGTKENKAKHMGTSWILEGSKTSKTKQMKNILDFWTCNLNESEKDGYTEKPFYELDGRIIQLPQRIGQQNTYVSIINYLRRLHKNRDTLKNETSLIEKSLAKLFEQCGFKVFYQYIPNDNSVGEIDLIIVDNDTILIIELKSTFIKTNLREAYYYQNTTLKKASFQLDRKLKYVQDNFTNFIDKPLSEIKFYSWIVDTTLEADHKKFNQHLKISLEELVIHLKGHQNFMDFYENFSNMENTQFNEINENQKVLSLQKLVDCIEKNTFWETSLKKHNEMLSKNK